MKKRIYPNVYMILPCIFFYYYVQKIINPAFHAPEGLHLGGAMAVGATALLLTSSITCEFAHHAIMHKEKGKARALLLSTLLLGTTFLMFQGYEYGLLFEAGYTPTDLAGSGAAAHSAYFYAATGFHGLHVAMGLVMLFLVYIRMEMGHFTKERHFSFIAASWYWHFVDVVWILLFITVYAT